jgi:hypothetical protein
VQRYHQRQICHPHDGIISLVSLITSVLILTVFKILFLFSHILFWKTYYSRLIAYIAIHNFFCSKSQNLPRQGVFTAKILFKTHIAPYYLISDVYDGKFKYYITPRVFAVEIRKYHQKNPLEKFYEIQQCKIAINYKLGILEQCKLTIPYYIQYTRRM